MSRRLESGIFDKLINGYIFKKRKLGLPIKYHYEKIERGSYGRFRDMLYFPKSNLDKLIGNIYERCLPGIKYFFWDEKVRVARECGLTLGEKLYHSFRHAPNILLHAMGQTIHPYGWLQAQRRDAFERQTEALIPGIQFPDWFQETRRAHDIDLNSLRHPAKAMDMIIKESTPSHHFQKNIYFFIQGFILNHRNQTGYPAQRLFYNEELRGDYYQNGYLTSGDKKIIHGWYANSQSDSQKERIDNMNEDERAEHERNVARWNKNYEEFYPEFNKVVHNPIMHKFDEPYYERNMQDIRSSIFTSKWIELVDKFTQEEIQDIHEFFLNDKTEVFFKLSGHSEEVREAEKTELYEKFIEVLDFPDIFEIDRFTTYPPEKQFYDIMDTNWNINFETVDSYKARYISLLKNNSNPEASKLILEEVYNPLYRHLLNEKFNFDVSENESFVLRALEKGSSIKELTEIAQVAKENVTITNGNVLSNAVNNNVRNVVKTFAFKGNL